jgi:threonine aldolase
MPHLIKIHGGTMYGNWANAAMALQRLEGLETRLKTAVAQSRELFEAMNKIPGIKISALDSGTNIYQMQLGKEVDLKKLRTALNNANIRIPGPDKDNKIMFSVNETLLYKDNNYIVDAFKKGMG